ncbi:rho GTPase-activating protein gacO-like [Cimex lectularius]|uniref:Uncharacterized protein n=1 Tax=Cimex lectularius TaxID=79782 RepID=A0A8I6RCA8_CIMLE|nr:rho GTPase-activating protein gacO-like [Cimex lectularius]
MSFNSVLHCKQKSMPILINPADGIDLRPCYQCSTSQPDRDTDFFSPPPDPWRMMYYPFPPYTPGMPPYSYYIYPVFGENLGLGPRSTRSFPCACPPKNTCQNYFHCNASRNAPRMCSMKLEYYQCPCCNSFFNPLGEYTNVQPPTLILPPKCHPSMSQFKKDSSDECVSVLSKPVPECTDNAKSLPSSSKSCPAAYEMVQKSQSRDINNSGNPERCQERIRCIPPCQQPFPSFVSLPNGNAKFSNVCQAGGAAAALSSGSKTPKQQHSTCKLNCCVPKGKSSHLVAGKKEKIPLARKCSTSQTTWDVDDVHTNTSDLEIAENKVVIEKPPSMFKACGCKDNELDTKALIRALKEFKACKCSREDTEIVPARLPVKPEPAPPPSTPMICPGPKKPKKRKSIREHSPSPSPVKEKTPSLPPPEVKKEKKEKNVKEKGKEEKEKKKEEKEKDKPKKEKEKKESLPTTPVPPAPPSTPVSQSSQKKPPSKKKRDSNIDKSDSVKKTSLFAKKMKEKKKKSAVKEDKRTKLKKRLKVIDSLKNLSSFTATHPLTLF